MAQSQQNKNFELLDHRLSKVEETVRELAKTITDYIKHQPKSFDLGASLRTVGMTTAIVTAIFTFLDNRYWKRGEGDDERAVLAYRVEQLEKHAFQRAPHPIHQAYWPIAESSRGHYLSRRPE